MQAISGYAHFCSKQSNHSIEAGRMRKAEARRAYMLAGTHTGRYRADCCRWRPAESATR